MDLRQHSASLRTININKDQTFAWCPQVHGGFFFCLFVLLLCVQVSCLYVLHPWCLRQLEASAVSSELKLQPVVKHCVGAGD